MGAEVLHIFDTLVSMGACAVCGIQFAAPEHYVKKRRDDHKDFYCPNGHVLVFTGESEAQKLRAELEVERKRTKFWSDQSDRKRAEVEVEKRRTAAARGQVTKIKNRVGNGVCPCCNRTFQNLQRHMHTKHPGYATENETAEGKR